MPVTKSAKRALKKDQRRKSENLKTKSAYKKAIAYFKKNLSAKNLSAAYAKIDRAAKKHIIHKNKAARLKSQLAKLLKEKKKK
jgi:small subunit ribosomal protein S20